MKKLKESKLYCFEFYKFAGVLLNLNDLSKVKNMINLDETIISKYVRELSDFGYLTTDSKECKNAITFDDFLQENPIEMSLFDPYISAEQCSKLLENLMNCFCGKITLDMSFATDEQTELFYRISMMFPKYICETYQNNLLYITDTSKIGLLDKLNHKDYFKKMSDEDCENYIISSFKKSIEQNITDKTIQLDKIMKKITPILKDEFAKIKCYENIDDLREKVFEILKNEINCDAKLALKIIITFYNYVNIYFNSSNSYFNKLNLNIDINDLYSNTIFDIYKDYLVKTVEKIVDNYQAFKDYDSLEELTKLLIVKLHDSNGTDLF